VSEYFYSRPVAGEVTLDDIITELEGDLGAVIGGYRSAAPGDRIDAAVAGRTVLHLVIHGLRNADRAERMAAFGFWSQSTQWRGWARSCRCSAG
jgi:hypothetical protein